MVVVVVVMVVVVCVCVHVHVCVCVSVVRACVRCGALDCVCVRGDGVKYADLWGLASETSREAQHRRGPSRPASH